MSRSLFPGRAIASGLFIALLLSACGAGSPGASTSCVDDPAACAASPGGTPSSGPSGSPEPSGSEGTWSGTVTRRWNETVTQSGDGVSSVITQTYEATVRITSTQTDIGVWDLIGEAIVKAGFDSDYESHQTTSLGPCDVRYTDKVPMTEFRGAVEGGLEIVEGFYQFRVSIPGFEGAVQTSVRDDTGCFGLKTTETNPWPVGPVSVGGSGDVTDPNAISGSATEPVTGGTDVNTWNLTRD